MDQAESFKGKEGEQIQRDFSVHTEELRYNLPTEKPTK